MSDALTEGLRPKEGYIVTLFLTVADVDRSAEFYARVLDGTVVRTGHPSIVQIANTWVNTWRAKGAEFMTEPKDHGVEIRCYMRDPDGYIIEVGQVKAG